MKKYFTILKMSFLESFQYIPTLVFRFISYFINMFALTSVWKYIYSDSSQIINGYTLNQMIWYLLLAETISYGSSNICRKEINEDIKSGVIAYKVNKPYQYIGYNFFRYIGDSVITLVLYTVVSILIGIVFVGKLNIDINFINILCILITVILAVSINGLIKIIISLSSFWVEDSTPFHWIYSKVLLIFGIFFPIEMFPKLLQPIIKCTPVYVVIYGPVKLFLGFSMNLFISILTAQLIYLVIVLLITILVYRKGVKKLNVNGG